MRILRVPFTICIISRLQLSSPSSSESGINLFSKENHKLHKNLKSLSVTTQRQKFYIGLLYWNKELCVCKSNLITEKDIFGTTGQFGYGL